MLSEYFGSVLMSILALAFDPALTRFVFRRLIDHDQRKYN